MFRGQDEVLAAASFLPENSTNDELQEFLSTYLGPEGLLVSELYDITKNVILNLVNLVEIYGFVPNGSRIYYLNRSQPPLLVQMVKIYYQATNNTTLLSNAFPILMKEYNFWRQNNSIRVFSPKSKKLHTLNRYIVQNNLPRQESYLDDFTTVELNNTLNSTTREQLYAEIATAVESGWDFSSR
ncbi:hypothetical protein Glove_40g168 [Diversispora epigaea]|uniref:Trehalase n=1 Tax=Diversispora epigaea TaxID=1348612 RepID=A0A397JK76_9GLOM|nr:hypothetical protein Glove_40g168 [Diversispora epigaea]